MSKRHRVTIYDAEKHFKTRNGTTTKSFLYDTKEAKDEKIKEIKEQQKEKNKLFKESLKDFAKREGTVIQKTTLSTFKLPKYRETVSLKLDRGTGNTVAIIASSKSGKSTLMMYLYDKYYNNKKYISTLFSPSYHIPLFKKGKLLIKSSSFLKLGSEYIQTQRYINQKCKNKYIFLNMFDDITDIAFDRIINNLILTYRNSNVSTIINTQYAKIISKKARSSMNNVIFMHLNQDEDIEETIRCFLKSMFFKKFGLTKKMEMIDLYRKLTENHGFMYFNPSSQSLTFHRLNLQKIRSQKKMKTKTKTKK